MTSNRVDRILRTIDETLDVGEQTPVPDPSFGEISPRVNGLCVRCQRVEPSGDAGYCDRCRAVVLGDDVPDLWLDHCEVRNDVVPGLGLFTYGDLPATGPPPLEPTSDEMRRRVTDFITEQFSRRILAVGGPLDGQVPEVPPHCNWFDHFNLTPSDSERCLEIVETVRYHRLTVAWGGMVHDVWLVEDGHARDHVSALFDRLYDWRKACEALAALRWVWGPRSAPRVMRYRFSIGRAELEKPYGWDVLWHASDRFLWLMDVEARRVGLQLDIGSLVWWMSPPQVESLGALFVDLRCEGLAR